MRFLRYAYLYLDDLINLSQKSNVKYKHGAIIIDEKGKVLSKAHNAKIIFSIKSKDELDEKKLTFHAEEICINKALNRGISLKNKILIAIRTNKNKEIKLSKPCKNCQKLMKKVGIKYCIYSVNKEKFEVIKF